MTTLTLEATAVTDALKRLAGTLQDMTPIMKKLGGVLEYSTEQNFQSEGARIGAKWKPSQRAIKQKGQTLIKDGHLVASITRNGAGHVNEVTPNSVFVGTNIKYAEIHQFGGTIRQNAQSRLQGFKINKRTGKSRFAKRGKANFEQWTSRGAYTIAIPARPFFGLNQTDEADLLKIIKTALGESVR